MGINDDLFEVRIALDKHTVEYLRDNGLKLRLLNGNWWHVVKDDQVLTLGSISPDNAVMRARNGNTI